jgi:hypothetical protein
MSKYEITAIYNYNKLVGVEVTLLSPDGDSITVVLTPGEAKHLLFDLEDTLRPAAGHSGFVSRVPLDNLIPRAPF